MLDVKMLGFLRLGAAIEIVLLGLIDGLLLLELLGILQIARCARVSNLRKRTDTSKIPIAFLQNGLIRS